MFGALEVPWQERGPAERAGHRPQHWRGQVFRPRRDGGTQRYGKRGDKWRENYAEHARSGRLVVKHKDPWHGISNCKQGKLQGKESHKGNMKLSQRNPNKWRPPFELYLR